MAEEDRLIAVMRAKVLETRPKPGLEIFLKRLIIDSDHTIWVPPPLNVRREDDCYLRIKISELAEAPDSIYLHRNTDGRRIEPDGWISERSESDKMKVLKHAL